MNKIQQWTRKTNAKRIKKGVCILCAKVKPEREGIHTCNACLEKRRAYAKKYKRSRNVMNYYCKFFDLESCTWLICQHCKWNTGEIVGQTIIESAPKKRDGVKNE